MDKHIYIVISKTQSYIGKLIRWFTKYEYNHVSISFDKELSQMYSFGRITIVNPLVGGMVKESTYTLSLGFSRAVDIKVYSIPVSIEQYNKILYFVNTMYKDTDGYYYNLLGFFGIAFGKKWSLYKTYTCSEFVIDALRYAAVHAVLGNKNLVYPRDIDKAIKQYICFEGNLFAYPYLFIDSASYDYFQQNKFELKKSLTFELLRSLVHFKMLVVRHFNSKRHY